MLRHSLAGVLSLAAGALACSSGNTEPSLPPGFSLVVGPTLRFMIPPESLPIGAHVLDSLGRQVTYPITYSVRSGSGARVSATGTLSAVSPGRSVMSVSAGNLRQDITVVVVTGGTTIARDSLLPLREVIPWGVGSIGPTVLLTSLLNDQYGYVSRANLPSTSLQGPFLTGSPTSVAFDSTGTLAYVTNAPLAGVSVFDLATNTLLDTLGRLSPFGPPLAIVRRPHTETYFVTAAGALFRFTSPALLVATLRAETATLVTHLAVHPSLPRLYLGGGEAVEEVNANTGQTIREFAGPHAIRGIAVSSAGDRLYIANEGGSVILWDLIADTLLITLNTLGQPFGIALDPGGAKLAVTASAPGTVYVIDTRRLEFTTMYRVGGTPRGLAFSSDGTLVVANEAGWFDFLH